MASVEIEKPGAQREKQVDAWHRTLNDGRMEVMARCPGVRLRVAGNEEQCWEAIEMFERWTGLHIHSERRPRRRVPVPPGQLAIEVEGDDG